MIAPSVAEVEHADWPALRRMASGLGLNPKGRSAVVRLRVLDHVRKKAARQAWHAGREHQAPILVRLGFPAPAAAHWEGVMTLDAPAPWVGLGAARLGAGELEEAAKAFDRAAQMGDATAFLHRAETAAAAGDFGGAVRACDAYLGMRPRDLRGLSMKADFLTRGGWADEGIAVLRSALEDHPDAVALWRGLGLALLRSGKHGPAAEAFHETLRADPRDVDCLINRGAALLHLGRTRDAIGAFREALEIDPSRAEALNNLGVAYAREDQVKSAGVNLERAAKRLETPQILRNVAHVRELLHHGEAKEAHPHTARPTTVRAVAAKPAPRRKARRKPSKRSPRRRPAKTARARTPPRRVRKAHAKRRPARARSSRPVKRRRR